MTKAVRLLDLGAKSISLKESVARVRPPRTNLPTNSHARLHLKFGYGPESTPMKTHGKNGQPKCNGCKCWPEDRLGASAGSVIDQNGDILSTIAPCLAAGLFPKPLLDFSFFSCRDLSRNVRCETGETASAAFRTGHFSHGCGLHHLDVHHARSCHILQLSGSSG